MKPKFFVRMFLLLAIIFGGSFFCQMEAYAEDPSGTCGTNVNWSLNTSTRELTISGTGNMTDYSSSSDVPWFSYRSSIKTVTIGSGVTSIGSYAFCECGRLTSVTIPDGVTSIGDFAFCRCYVMPSIYLPNSVTSIGEYVFSVCSTLRDVDLGGSVSSIPDDTFSECSELVSVSGFDCVTSIGERAFYHCDSLPTITIPGCVSSIGRKAFQDCYALTSVNIPEGVTSIADYVFSGCRSLTSFTIPENVTSIGKNAFASCYGLTSVTIPDSVTEIAGSTFSSCWSLTSVAIPANVISIGQNAFDSCTSLTSITLPSVASLDTNVFNRCTNLSKIFYGNSLISGLPTTTKNFLFIATDNTTTPKKVKIINSSDTESKIALSCSDIQDGYAVTEIDDSLTNITLSHGPFSAWRDGAAATCTSNATRILTCSVCGAEESQEVPNTALGGHQFKVDLANNKVKCTRTGCGFEKAIQSVEAGELTLSQTNYTSPTFSTDGSVTVLVKSSNGTELGSASVTLSGSQLPAPAYTLSDFTPPTSSTDATVKIATTINGATYDKSGLQTITNSKLPRNITLKRSTYDLVYDNGVTTGFEGSTLAKPTPNSVETLTKSNFDSNTFTLKLKHDEACNIKNYKITANGYEVTPDSNPSLDNGIFTETFSIPLNSPNTLINIECPFDANKDGVFRAKRDFVTVVQL